MENSEQQAKEAEEIFRNNAVISPSRKVNIPIGKIGKSLSEIEDDVGNPSDLQASLKRLFPKFAYRVINQVASAVMVGRVLHDTMLDRINLTVTAIIEDWDIEEDGELDVMLVINLVTTAYEIGLDSKGRVDIVELHGAAESEELDKVADAMARI